MRKIFQIANYDFKRLALNPIALIVMAVVLGVCLILGFAYKIEPAYLYTATISGETTQEIYQNFMSNNSNLDSKMKLDRILAEAKYYLAVQDSAECPEFEQLEDVNKQFQNIYFEIEKFHSTGSCTYTTNNNINAIKTAAYDLNNFLTNYDKLDEFQSRLIFKTNQFETLTEISNYFNAQVNSNASVTRILQELYKNLNKINSLKEIVNDVFTWTIDDEIISEFQEKYINKAQAKLNKITAEIQQVAKNNTQDQDKIEYITSLITNYKLMCESAKYSIKFELQLLLETYPVTTKDLYNYTVIPVEDTKLELVKMNFYLDKEDLSYTQYQAPLNFNKASYKVTTFDHAYFIISIVGFLIILFGIFCAYKLFGIDRKNGKIDLILSQNVTFNQVFAGKFLAIVYSTSFFLAIFAVASTIFGAIFYAILPNSILAIFNLTTAYTIHPMLFLLIKIAGIEMQVMFYSVITLFLMNVSRKFNLWFGISLGFFVIATICNIFLNNALWYCLFPFIHADVTSFLGGGTMQAGFLKTALYTSGSFFISIVYYLVVVALLYNLTKQLFKKN